MSKTGSYIKLDRGLKTNSLWLEKPFSRGQAWVDLLLFAQGVDKEKLYRGKVQKLCHGNIYTSMYFLADRWGWSRSKVYRFLEELMYSGMIEIQGWTTNDTKSDAINRNKNKTKNGTVITVVNWEVYQYTDTNNDTNNDTANRKTKSKKTIHTIESKRKKENDKENIPPKSPKGGQTPDGVIPEIYRNQFKTYDEYLAWRNQ